MEFISLLLIVIIIASIVGIVNLLYYYSKTRYYNFVKKNSTAIKDLKELNEKYHFMELGEISYTHNYDNEKMFDNVSCYDYLVYQLQFYNNRKEILDDINLFVDNNILYNEYLQKVKYIRFDEFEEAIGNLKIEKLRKIEKEEFDKFKLHPATEFKVKIILKLENMAGRYIRSKVSIFSENDVCEIIDLLKERDGDFYLNRNIWDSICRVERARVSNKMRFSIYDRDHYTCRMCHRRFSSDQLEIDHIYPIAKGGKSTYDNLQTLCKKCNKEKGDKII